MDFSEKQIDILKAAEKLFSEKGFDRTSVRDIAALANVNVAMINYYFGSKDNLLEAFFAFRVPDFMMDISVVAPYADMFEKLEKMIDLYIRSMNSHSELYRVIAIESSIKLRMLKSNSYAKMKKHNLDVVRSVIDEGIEKGCFKPGNPIELIYAVMMGAFMNFQMNQSFLKAQLNIDSDQAYSHYIETTLSQFIQKTIKALLTYEK